MANPEHLKILKQGVEAWNKWRKKKRGHDIEPDLTGADLSGMKLRGIDFSWTDLMSANLSKVDILDGILDMADLRNADLSGANLSYADLTEANLEKANLSGTILTGAVLNQVRAMRAVFHGAMLDHADLSDADFSYANFSRAHLENADLREANLTLAKLVDAQLNRAALMWANLDGANLSSAKLFRADLSWINLRNADLRAADLRFCRLVSSNLHGAILTGTRLYGTARDDWNIQGIECSYVYWDYIESQRFPKERDLEPGEFERLYSALPTIEYVFERGISLLDPLIMDRVIQAIREKQPEFDIRIDSINARGLAPSIKFTVQHEEHREPALEEVTKEYEIRLRQLESERDRYYQLLAHALDAPKEVKLINAAPGSIVATDGSTVSVEQHIHNALELQRAIAGEPEGSESFAKVVKKTAMDIIGEVIKDIAKGQVKKAAKQIIELGKDLGPIITRTTAYLFFKSIGA